MPRNTFAILALFLTVYIVLTIFHPGGLMAYAFPATCWSIMALTTVYAAGGLKKIRSWTNNRITLMALLAALFQIFIMVDAGLISRFGRSPVSFAPIAIVLNLTMVTTTLLGTELSRAYFAKNLKRKNPALVLAVVTVLYAFIDVSVLALLNFADPLTYSKFIGKDFLPALTGSLLATYLALLSGPIASLVYRAPLEMFRWFSPILPDLPWGYESLIGVMIPTIGFVAINLAIAQKDLRKAGIQTQRKSMRAPRIEKSQKSTKGWMLMSLFLVLTVWTSTGLLGFYPTIIASGSMRPTLDVGDVSIVIPVDPAQIQVGDIIQYWQEGEMTLHRVYDIYQTEASRLFITKGEANTAPDIEPVFPKQIRGRLIFTIPKLGWASIYIKTAIASIWSYLSNNSIATYVTLTTVTIMASIYTIHTYKKRSHNHWRRKTGT